MRYVMDKFCACEGVYHIHICVTLWIHICVTLWINFVHVKVFIMFEHALFWGGFVFFFSYLGRGRGPGQDYFL